MHRRWPGIDKKDPARAENRFSRRGLPSLLLAWLPVVGDPPVPAGLLGVGLGPFLVPVGIGKFARYDFLAWLVT